MVQSLLTSFFSNLQCNGVPWPDLISRCRGNKGCVPSAAGSRRCQSRLPPEPSSLSPRPPPHQGAAIHSGRRRACPSCQLSLLSPPHEKSHEHPKLVLHPAQGAAALQFKRCYRHPGRRKRNVCFQLLSDDLLRVTCQNCPLTQALKTFPSKFNPFLRAVPPREVQVTRPCCPSCLTGLF